MICTAKASDFVVHFKTEIAVFIILTPTRVGFCLRVFLRFDRLIGGNIHIYSMLEGFAKRHSHRLWHCPCLSVKMENVQLLLRELGGVSAKWYVKNLSDVYAKLLRKPREHLHK